MLEKLLKFCPLIGLISPILISILKWIKEHKSSILQKISENLKEIDYKSFAGNHLRNNSVLYLIKESELRYFRKVQGFRTIWYVYNTNQGKNPHNNLNTDECDNAIKKVFMSLRKKDKRRLYKIYKARQK